VVTYKNFGDVTITATCPNGANSSIRLSIPVGLIRETYHNEQHYSFYDAGQSGNGTKTAHVWHDGYLSITSYMQNATTGRADIKCFDMPLYLHAGNYPILAIKMQDVKDVDAGIKSRNINLDCVGTSQKGTSFKALGGGNNKYSSDLRCSDGSHVFVYDMTRLNFGTGGKAPADEYIQFSVFQFKYADMKSVDHQITYNLYWVQTFRSMDELESYLTHVDKVSYE
jgi:hypothetical protein